MKRTTHLEQSGLLGDALNRTQSTNSLLRTPVKRAALKQFNRQYVDRMSGISPSNTLLQLPVSGIKWAQKYRKGDHPGVISASAFNVGSGQLLFSH